MAQLAIQGPLAETFYKSLPMNIHWLTSDFLNSNRMNLDGKVTQRSFHERVTQGKTDLKFTVIQIPPRCYLEGNPEAGEGGRRSFHVGLVHVIHLRFEANLALYGQELSQYDHADRSRNRFCCESE